MEHCIAPFLEDCDQNKDHRITLQVNFELNFRISKIFYLNSLLGMGQMSRIGRRKFIDIISFALKSKLISFPSTGFARSKMRKHPKLI